jgi:hypothetical protein
MPGAIGHSRGADPNSSNKVQVRGLSGGHRRRDCNDGHGPVALSSNQPHLLTFLRGRRRA